MIAYVVRLLASCFWQNMILIGIMYLKNQQIYLLKGAILMAHLLSSCLSSVDGGLQIFGGLLTLWC